MLVLCGSRLKRLQQLLMLSVFVKVFSESLWATSKGDVIACLVQSGEGPGSQSRLVFLGKDACGEECFVLRSQHPVRHRIMSLLFAGESS